ncbi:hypothetical protein [Microbacterium soli]|uniref:Uncharacterized protein n=1 Tax=Microbacterium soli TaxID=446075 RepID=A0ABP7MTN7_9MICO
MADDVPDEIDDPFWAVVHRRHPDLDIVLLPPAQPAPDTSGLEPRAPETFAHEHLAEVDRVWADLVGHGMPLSTARWIPGPTHDSVCHTVTLALGGVEESIALVHLRAAAELLAPGRWRVFIPPRGMPRVTADRDGRLGDEHLLFGYAIENRTLFLRLDSTGVPVGGRRAQGLIGDAA